VSSAPEARAPLPHASGASPTSIEAAPAVGMRSPDAGSEAHRSGVGWLAWLYVALAGVWAAVALSLLVQLAFCHVALLRLGASCEPVWQGSAAETLRDLCASLGLREPQLLAGPRVRSPFLAGLRHPAILLPASYAADFDAEALRAI